MRKMMRIAAGLAALVLVAVMAGCKGKEKSNVAVEIAGAWGYTVTQEDPEWFESFHYEFGTNGGYFYEHMAMQRPAINGYGTYSVNAKQGKIKLTLSEGYYEGDGTFEIKGDTLVDEKGRVFTKEQWNYEE